MNFSKHFYSSIPIVLQLCVQCAEQWYYMRLYARIFRFDNKTHMSTFIEQFRNMATDINVHLAI